MTNSIAFFLGLGLLAAVGVDYYLFGTDHMLFLSRKFLELLEWVAFWR